jgi:hypothetical protein
MLIHLVEKEFSCQSFFALIVKKMVKGDQAVDELRFPEGPRRQYGIGPFVDRKLASAL